MFLFSLSLSAETYSGACGDNLTWTLDTESGILTISGSGAMTDYSYENHAPWYSYCSSITSAVISDGVTSIGDYAIYGCSSLLTSITIPCSVTSIGYRAFRDCSITSIICEATTPPACHQFFINKAYIPIYVPAESIELYRADNILKNYNIFPIGSSSYGSYGDNLSWVFSNDGVLTISGTGAMKNISGSNYFCYEGDLLKYFRNSVKNIIVSDGVTTIGTGMCDMCNHLTSVYLPKSITKIESDAFQTGTCYSWICGGGTGLDDPDPDPFDAPIRKSNDDNGCNNSIISMTCEAVTPPAIGDNAFNGMDYSIPLYVHAQSVEAYKAADGWKDFSNILPIGGQEECKYETTDGATVWEDELPYTWESVTFNEAGTETLALQASDGCDSVVTFTLRVRYHNIVLQDNENADYYTQFAEDYNGYTVNTATLNRRFTQGKWATLCLPFNVSKGMMMALGLNARVYEFRYAETVDNLTVIYFAVAQSIEAGKGYIVNANAKLAQKTSFVFPNVTINTDVDNEDITALTGYNDNSGRGSIYLVGTLRTGKLQGTTNGNIYLGLKDNMLYYPNTVTGTNIRAYRGFFRSEVPLNTQRVRIIVDGEERGEFTIDNGELIIENSPAVKYVENGILYIRSNGKTYNAQGQRLD